MAEGKKSFVFYADYLSIFELLENEDAGKLIKHLLRYVNDLKPEFKNDELLLKIAFEPIKLQLKRDLKDWEETRHKRSEAGHLGGIRSAESRRSKQNQANQATLKSGKQNQANQAVNVTVNDTVTDNVRDNTTSSDVDMVSPPIVGIVKSKQKKKRPAPKKKGSNPDSEPYWKQIRAKWIWFNKTHVKFNVEPIPDRDYSHMKKIIQKLRERATGQAILWTEENALLRWEKFLTTAFTQDKWLHDNFLLSDLEGRMQKIFNLIENPNGTHQQSTSTGVKGNSKSAGAHQLLASLKGDLNTGRK